MHRYVVSDAVKQRLIGRQGKLVSHDTIEAARTALVVVDMQNYFVAEGYPAEIPVSREIVPVINRLAKAVRAAGGIVVWIQTTVARSGIVAGQATTNTCSRRSGWRSASRASTTPPKGSSSIRRWRRCR